MTQPVSISNCIIRAATAVTIDSKEWAIVVGTPPAGFTVIDTVNNNPASGYWAPPGNGGVTAASAENPTIIDLVSMSRVTVQRMVLPPQVGQRPCVQVLTLADGALGHPVLRIST